MTEPEKEINGMINAVEQANTTLEKAMAEWDKYQRLKKDVQEAGKNNPYTNDRAINRIIQYADNFKSEFGNVALMESAVFLVKNGRTREQIQKIIKVAYDMAIGGVIYYNIAAELLHESLNCDTARMGVIYPEIEALTKEELAGGKAIDYIEKKLGENNA
jgi:hypothetical protein